MSDPSPPPTGAQARVGAAVIAGAFVVWNAITWLAARAEGYSPVTTGSWGRWDTGWYRFIAQHGYSFGRCDNVPNRGPDDYCGAAGWFPGFPYVNRAVSQIGIGVDTAGRYVALVALALFLAIVWFGFLASRPRPQALAAMALVAVFPGAIYYGAIFPVSIVIASMAGCLALVQRHRWLLAGLTAMPAVVSYPSGVVIGVAAVVPLFAWTAPRLPGPRARLVAAASIAGPVVAAYLLVLLNYQRAVGRWDAWFRVQEAYGYEPTPPWVTVWHQLQLLTDAANVRTPGAQTALVVVLMAVAITVAARRWRDLGSGERAALAVAVALWLVPLILGGPLSLYRAESLLVPVVLVIARARPAVIAGLALVALPVAYNMARLFFDHVLI